jgi:hypothetical protein
VSPILIRRFLSIVSITALLASVASPLVAAACPHEQQVQSCHGIHKAQLTHHGDAIGHQHHMEVAMESEGSALLAAELPKNCPMDCCVAGHITTVAAVSNATSLPSLVATNRSCNYTSVVFACHGFSSHTDRGPPSV